MRQLPLPLEPIDGSSASGLLRRSFSHDDACPQEERISLEQQYADLLEETARFDRRWVSYQGNKGEILHSWMKYREGFSAQLVECLLDEFDIHPGDTILEPFSGSGTTLLVAKSRGINSVGIEILPVCHLAWDAKSLVFDYDLDELNRIYETIVEVSPHQPMAAFPHLAITDGAFPQETENELMFFTHWVEQLNVSEEAKLLLRLVLTSILEEVSYTRKDGQYLRWDSRSRKMQQRNESRTARGKKPIKGMHKGDLPAVKEVFLRAFATIMADIGELQGRPGPESRQKLIKGSTLTTLPILEEDRFDSVITSPPYCNRYDYTRTYALELAYLGVGEEGVRELRQSQLSCTVENRSKTNSLRSHYTSLGQLDRYERIMGAVLGNPVFNEINRALWLRWKRGQINNRGILPMVKGYFIELSFVFAEILRTCRSGACVAFVNDNVRYGGEVIPVDLLSTNLAETLGFEPVKVYVLPQRKGNSSQQMGRFGREALRKSITVWKKP
jgi:DNA modification methylase